MTDAYYYLWVGIGCQRGTSCEFISAAIKHVFQQNNLFESAITGVATINTKANETGLIEYCSALNLPLVFFSTEQLQNIYVPNPSQIVASKVQTLSVAEAAAMIAASVDTLYVSKQIIRSVQNLKGTVTLAVAYSTTLKT
ncbi:cobalamin biosynthesis protein CbiG [Calothrix sp. HK-06]|nr:cobalamin biosynthesis protein CbiG [Calothrix sp. HK-06]